MCRPRHAADQHRNGRGGTWHTRQRADLRCYATTADHYENRKCQHMGLFTPPRSGTAQHMAETCEDESCRRLPCVMFKAGYRKGYDRGYSQGWMDGEAAGYSAGFAAGMAAAGGGS